MKRLIFFLMAVCVTMSLMTVGAYAEDAGVPAGEPAAAVTTENDPEAGDQAEPAAPDENPSAEDSQEASPGAPEPDTTDPAEPAPVGDAFTVCGTTLVVQDYASAEAQGAFSAGHMEGITAVCFTCPADGVTLPENLTVYYPYGDESWGVLAGENSRLLALIGTTVPGTEDTSLVTFTYRSETIAVEAVVNGETPAVLPEVLGDGTEIYGWFLQECRVDAAALPVETDTEYAAVTAPGLITREHPAYVSGRGQGNFDPKGSLTRAEAAVMFSNLLDAEGDGKCSTAFTDVNTSDWFYDSVTCLASYGLVSGYGDGTYLPYRNITRAEFVTILANLFPIRDGEMPFTDVPAGHWAYSYIVNAYAYGWSVGYDGCFRPDSKITRAEAVTMLNAVMGRDADSETTQALTADANLCSFRDVSPGDWFYRNVLEAATVHTFEMNGAEENWNGFTYTDTGYTQGIVTIDRYQYVVDENGQFTNWTYQPGVAEVYGQMVHFDSSLRIDNLTLKKGINQLSGQGWYVTADGRLDNSDFTAGMNLIDGYYYHLNEAGWFDTYFPGHVAIDDKVWYVDAKGLIPAMPEGITRLPDSTTVCVQADGSLLTNGDVDELHFDENGTCTTGDHFTINNDQAIMHAAGVLPSGVTGSNSIEAMQYTYGQGYRYLEVDFCWTSDDQLVCIHDWTAFYGTRMTLEEFEEKRTKYGFTSMELSDVAEFLQAHPDLHIITDIKEDNVRACRLIAETYPELLDQFIIQIYAPTEYAEVSALGFRHIWMTLYYMAMSEKTDPDIIAEYLQTAPVEAIVFPAELLELSGYLENMKELGLPLYVHTVNDSLQQIQILESGVYGIYTDSGFTFYTFPEAEAV